jgi:N-acetylglucosamine-6-sulfatase
MAGSIGSLRRARRVRLVATLLAAAASLAALVSVPPGAGARRPQARQPNILVIMTDDETVENMRVMRNVNRLLGTQGVTFDDSVVSYSLCCPSRATFLTGQYSHNNGVLGNNYENGLSRLDETNTLPVWLQHAGYTTALIGKYLNGYGVQRQAKVPPGWSEWYGAVHLAYFNHSLSRNGKMVTFGRKARDYQTDVYTRLALNFVARHARSSKPFFLWLSYWAPHDGSPHERGDPKGVPTPVPAPRHKGRFKHEYMPTSKAFDEHDMSDKPLEVRHHRRFTARDIAGIRADYRQRLESLLAVDEGVAKVVAALRARHALGRTLIVFTSDNGFLQGEHRLRQGKEWPYEPSIRVPLLMSGPGIPHGRHIDEPVANIDVAPTLVDAAHATAARKMDGRSLWPLFSDPELGWGRDILLERGPGKSYLGARQFTGIRTPRDKYVEYRDGERELYDLGRDPDELVNRANDPAYSGVVAELARRLALLRDCAGASCRVAPELDVSLAPTATCAHTATVSGPDVRFVSFVDFLVNRRGVGRDEAPPFEETVTGTATSSAQARLRAVVTMQDGRRFTLDRTFAPC